MIQFTITIAKDNLEGTGAQFTLNTENADQTEKETLALYLSQQGMTLAEEMNNSQLKRLTVTAS
ncbi:MAG: hypothetical protein ACREE6_13350 [Limisphaerales bacterium]